MTDLYNWVQSDLSRIADDEAQDPLGNEVRKRAFELSEKLQRGDTSLNDIQNAITKGAARGVVERAKRFRAYHEHGVGLAENDFSSLISNLPTDFDGFQKALNETRGGVVFTAHPTFAHSPEIRSALAAFASSPSPTLETALCEAIAAGSAQKAISLKEEHDEVLAAIINARAAKNDFDRQVLNEAMKRFGERWRQIEPATISVATWVGYDLDGRTDIRWFETIRIRLDEKARQLSHYCDRLKPCMAADIADDVSSIATRLGEAQSWTRACERHFSEDLDDPEKLVVAANALTGDHPARLTSLSEIIAKLNMLSEKTSDHTAQVELHLLAADMSAYGLGMARIHLRINAAQIRSALRDELSMGPEQAFLDRTILDLAAARFAETDMVDINFASLFSEKMTARRQLMLCAQIKKHIDADTPIRFLIAECEAPATVMGAIYLARKYGVDDLVDVSPLFETPDAIEKGGRLIERLLAEESYRNYVRRRGVLAIQLGFSDSGRFMGQLSSNMAIERLHILLAREMARRNLTDIRTILFNTHGESMGRGGFPGALQERFDYILTPWARARYERDNIPLTGESSFQGGDGFLHFATPTLARATIASLIAWSIEHPECDKNDRFYADINFSWDIYRAVKNWQESLFSSTFYQSILLSIGPNLLPLTGSRKVKRDSGASAGDVAKSLRAIPNNAILQQLAAPTNVMSGLGTAAAREQERFEQLVANSNRVQSLMKIAYHARALTSLSTLRAFASLYDPSFWMIRARHSSNANDALPYIKVGDALVSKSLHNDIEKLANLISKDRFRFDLVRARSGEEGGSFDPAIYGLQILRLALVMNAFRLVAIVPEFSSRHDVSFSLLMDAAFNLRFADVANHLSEIFPEARMAPPAFGGLSEKSSALEVAHGYPEIHKTIIKPLLKTETLIKETTRAIAHYYDAFG